MTGVLYARISGATNTDKIHLWERDGHQLHTSCGKSTCDIADSSPNGYLIENDQTNWIVSVVQQEAFKQANSGYCQECLENHPKASKFIPE